LTSGLASNLEAAERDLRRRLAISRRVSRADLAAESLERYLIAHLIMHSRWPDGMLDRDESHYWTLKAGRQRSSNRDLLLYASKPSKVAENSQPAGAFVHKVALGWRALR
jgi:hypothetical protein